MNGKILIVEDDVTIAAAMEAQLKKWDFEPVRVKDFRRVLEEFAEAAPQLVLMDISLPCFSGYYWCSEIRKISKVPIIFISSASDNMNIIMAMNMGGDDFIAKPFDLGVMSAKVQAVMRRTYAFGGEMNIIERGGVILDLGGSAVQCPAGRVELTKNELRILQVLFENAGSVVPRDVLMQRLWESESFIDDNTLTVNITRLRRKLEEAGVKNLILTRKGQGYMVE